MVHGVWTDANDVWIIAISLGTQFTWSDVSDKFQKKFESPADSKDVSSRFNKSLKKQPRALALERFLVDAGWPKDPEHAQFIDAALVVLEEIPRKDRFLLESDGEDDVGEKKSGEDGRDDGQSEGQDNLQQNG